HPHVFGDVDAADPDAVKANWETIKAAERAAKAEASGGGPTSVLDGVPFAQPAVLLADELQRRAVRNGVPADLIADDGAAGGGLSRAGADGRAAGQETGTARGSGAGRFDARVRRAEGAARADGHEPRELDEEQWRTYWARTGV